MRRHLKKRHSHRHRRQYRSLLVQCKSQCDRSGHSSLSVVGLTLKLIKLGQKLCLTGNRYYSVTKILTQKA